VRELARMPNRLLVPFLNLGHLLDHLAMLVISDRRGGGSRARWTARTRKLLPPRDSAASSLCGAFAIPRGWLADHWSRYRHG